MIKTKLAAPLYILRQECEKDLFLVLQKLKELGFDGVEFLGFFGRDPKDIRNKLDELDLKAVGNHVDYLEFMKDIQGTIAIHKQIGCGYITISGLSKQTMPDENALSEYINNVIKVGKLCRGQGITLLYHNHDHELKYKIKDKYLLEVILDSIPADCLSYEPDLGWIAIGGAVPEYFLDKYYDRCPVIHLKDYYAEDTKRIGNVSELNSQRGDKEHSFFEFRPIGYGIANTPALIKKAMICNPEWIVADHDLAYERDSYFDLKISYDYIKNLLILQK